MKILLKIAITLAMLFVILSPTACSGYTYDTNSDTAIRLPYEGETDVTPPSVGMPNATVNGNSSEKTEHDETTDTDGTNEFPASTEEGKDVLVLSLVNGLNVRSGLGTSYASLGTLDKGDMVAFVSYWDGWYETVYKERTAYVSANENYTALYYMDKGSERTESVIEVGKTLLGYPYVWGSERYHWGNGILNTNFVAGEFDCSALTQYAYYKGAGVLLDVTTRTQVKQGTYVAYEDLRRGDLMFFTNSSRYNLTGTERVGHVAIYLGDNYILHTASDHAVIEPISAARRSYFIEGRRVL